GAQVGDHKRPDFPVLEALAANTHGLEALLAAAAEQATTPPILATGSYFEQDEAAGPPNRPAFSPYALSKGLTWQYYRYFAARAGIRLAKFIVANPFGPWEKGGFTSFLARSWLNGETPLVKTPDYIRDNVPVNLMAACYAWQAEQLATGQGPDHLAPSCYAGTQGDFGYRFAKEMGTRLGVPCQLETQPQTDYSEPQIRLNTDPAKTLIPSWSETNFWDELAEWYHEANR
ncbi:MAG: NAD-dependent epimerase/dehydratase family protein, partial [Opitutales bacterium]